MSRDAWYHDAVSYVTSAGLFQGTSPTRFLPGGLMTRSMLVTVLYRAAGKPAMPEANWGYPYADVDARAYYGTAVYWARQRGVADGYSDGRFAPDDPITREQLAVMLWRYAGKPTGQATLDGFSDGAAAGDYARTALGWAVEQGILTGKGGGVLDPGGQATRAEVVAMLTRYLNRKS